MRNLRPRLRIPLVALTLVALIAIVAVPAEASVGLPMWVGQKTVWGFNYTPGGSVDVTVTRFWYDANGSWAGQAVTVYHTVATKPYKCSLTPAPKGGLSMCWPPPAGGFWFIELSAFDAAPGASLQVFARDNVSYKGSIGGSNTGPCPAGTQINTAIGVCIEH